MSHTEHRAPRPSTGSIARLSASLHRVHGSGAPSARRIAVVATVAFFATSLLAAIDAVPALADTAPGVRAVQVPAATIKGTEAVLKAEVNPENGPSETEWKFQYAESNTGPWTNVSGGSGTLAGSDENWHEVEAPLTGLSPTSTYYVRLVASNEGGETVSKTVSFTTTGPGIRALEVPLPSLTATEAVVKGEVNPENAETEWKFQYREAGSGTWNPAPGGATLAADESWHPVQSTITGLSAETRYFVRLVATNADAEATSSEKGFETDNKPAVNIDNPNPIGETSATLNGRVNPGYHNQYRYFYEGFEGIAASGAETEWKFEISTSPTSGFTVAGSGTITEAEASEECVGEYYNCFKHVHVNATGLSPDTVYYSRLTATNDLGTAVNPEPQYQKYNYFETSGPPSVETFVVHSFDGEKIHVIGSVVPHNFDTHYYFEFGKSTAYGEPPTPAVDVGSGGYNGIQTTIVAADLNGLEPGTTYHYRLSATSPAGGGTTVHGNDQTVTVPVPGKTAEGKEEGQHNPCPNEQFRNGPSAKLPDCRAYEQVTPAEKEGAQDIYQNGATQSVTTAGLDGEHVAISTLAKWGNNVNPGADTIYLFSRTPSGWQMTSTAPQPQTGGFHYGIEEIFTPDLSNFLVSSGWQTTFINASPEIEFMVGPAGGPYTKVASVPRSDQTEWKSQSRDGSVAILKTEDHKLLGSPTGTTEGSDLYEWKGGQLHQLNVEGVSTIGTCGAMMAHGWEGEGQGTELGQSFSSPGSINSISKDGSRVFFEAVPSSNCGEPAHLYMRHNGTETIDIGEYTFHGANPEGTKLLLSKGNCTSNVSQGCEGPAEFFSYDTETETVKHLFDVREIPYDRHVVSEDGNVLYFGTEARLTPEAPAIATNTSAGADNVYRYDIATETMSWVTQPAYNGGGGGGGYYTSPDGRYLYWDSQGGSEVAVPGVPGANVRQSYRYDATENVIQCMSCASPFDPEPKLGSEMMDSDGPSLSRPSPLGMTASANGDFAFFASQSELVPQDVNGEIENSSGTSPSSDVYEWRKNGVDGCAHVQGCLALITNGIDGTYNELLGTTPSGRDVFIATHSQLVPQDKDTQGDLYDVRIGGGFPAPPPRPVECEGDACHNPTNAPNDPTPSSSNYEGPGNEHFPEPKEPKKHHKHNKRHRHHKRHHKRHKRAGANRGGRK